jgi:hypothetical protein
VQVWAGVCGSAQVVCWYEAKAGVACLVRFLRGASQSSEAFEGADQRPPLSGAERSKLGSEKEHAHLVTRPRVL